MSDHVLHLGDCIEGMRGLEDKSVDHVICDPPFASEIYERGTGLSNHQTASGGKSPGQIVMRAGGIGYADDLLAPMLAEAARIVRRWVVVFMDVESVGKVREALLAAGLRYVRTGAWIKTDPMPQFSGDRPAHGFEVACIAHTTGGKMRWNGGGKAALWVSGICKQDRPDHPCPKPLPLMEALVSDFTDPGELACDPFAGSGTTAVACKRLGRRFIGWEKDPKFHAAAVKRIEAARQQYDLLPRRPKPKQLSLPKGQDAT